MNELSIPKNDIDCWNKYPKFRWVFETTKLFDSQHKKWSFVSGDIYTCETSMDMFEKDLSSVKVTPMSLPRTSGQIFVGNTNNIIIDSQVIIQKGEIKWLAHYKDTEFLEQINANVEVRIAAFVIMYFQKWNGVLTVRTIDHEIHCVKLMPNNAILQSYPKSALDLLNKVYRKVEQSK